MEKPKAILKVGTNELKYNYKFLATLIIMEDDNLVKLIKYVYQINEYITRVLQLPTENFIKNEASILRFKGLVYIFSKLR